VEIIVADDGSTDRTSAIAGAAGVVLVGGPPRGPSAARNAAVRVASGDVLAFTDADCTVERGWLAALVRGLIASGAASVGGPQRNVFAGDQAAGQALDALFRWASVVSDYARADTRPREVPHNASCNSAYRRGAFVEVGGFAEDLWPGEDVDLDFRLARRGYRAFYVPDAVVVHHRPSDPEWFRRMMRRYGRAQRELVARHGAFRAIQLLPAGLTAIGLLQVLLLSRRRGLVMAIDAALVLGGWASLARAVPVRLWPAVLRLAAVALVEWHRGFLESQD
jgi:GT2 family glycosyltransferase